MHCIALHRMASALLMYTLSALRGGVFYYQTLTAGGDAVLATFHAAPPVNRQFDMMPL